MSPVLINPDRFTAAGGSTAYRDAVLGESILLAYWRQGELSGTTMADASPLGHGGSYVGSPTLGVAGLITGDTDAAVTYDGSTQYGDVANASWMNSLTSFALEAVIKTTSATANGNIISRASAQPPWRLGIASGKAYMAVRTTAGETVLVGAVTINTGSKFHLCGTWDGSTIRLFVNGTADGTSAKTGSVTTPAVNLRIATRASAADQSFPGTVDEAAIYGVTSGTSGALSSARVAAHAALV